MSLLFSLVTGPAGRMSPYKIDPNLVVVTRGQIQLMAGRGVAFEIVESTDILTLEPWDALADLSAARSAGELDGILSGIEVAQIHGENDPHPVDALVIIGDRVLARSFYDRLSSYAKS